MRAIEFTSAISEDRLDEVGPLVSIANWFAKKYHDTLATGAQKMGAGKLQNFTNQHFRVFMQFMGMNKVDWPDLTMYVLYRYMRLVMKLDDQDILNVVNSVMVDPTVKGKKFKNISQIRDLKKNVLVSSLGTVGGDPTKLGQVIGEKIIASGAMQQIQNNWDTQAGISKQPPPQLQSKPKQTPASPAPAAASSTQPAKQGDVKTASDGKDYRLNIGKTGDRLWINIGTGEAASDAIDVELEGGNP